jgi:hypothetical protein
MGDSSTTTTDLDQTDEDILTFTVSDEALEAAAAGTQTGVASYFCSGMTLAGTADCNNPC